MGGMGGLLWHKCMRERREKGGERTGREYNRTRGLRCGGGWKKLSQEEETRADDHEDWRGCIARPQASAEDADIDLLSCIPCSTTCRVK